MSPAKKRGGAKRGAKKAAVKKSAAKKSIAKKSIAKKSVAKKSVAKKSPARKSATKKSVAKKSPAKKSPAKKSPAKKSAAKKSAAKKAPARKSPSRKSAAKTTGRRTAAKRPAPKQRVVVQTPEEMRAAAAAARADAKRERRSRAAARRTFIAERMGHTDLNALTAALQRKLARKAPAPKAARRAGQRRMAPAVSDMNRWVPIGPSVVRRGQADGRPRVTGRVRDFAVDSTGLRAYAATGKGGVWYTEDAGTSWRAVGGWVNTPGSFGGASTDLSCGSLLVEFGATAAADYVMVGTGELVGQDMTRVATTAFFKFGGRGILAGRAPTQRNETEVPFTDTAGSLELENEGVLQLVRDPSRPAGSAGTVGDRVIAATTAGLYLGLREDVGGELLWNWERIEGLEAHRSSVVENPPADPITISPAVSDVVWVPMAGNPDGRIVAAIDREGLIYSDALGADGTWTWMPTLNRHDAAMPVSGRHTLAPVVNDTLYVLIGRTLPAAVDGRDDDVEVHRIPNITRTAVGGGPGASQLVAGAPVDLWGTQRHHNQALLVERIGGRDRVWMGGQGIFPFDGAEFSASVYCFDVAEAGAGAPRLEPAEGVSRIEAPPDGEGSDVAGYVGSGIHADVHCIRVVTTPSGAKHVWVTSDGGVYLSELGGRVNTFQSRGNGLAAIEAGFVALHPTSSHYCAIGAQDNGVQSRSGDTMWEMIMAGDGGGVAFHPTAPQVILGQFIRGTWRAVPEDRYVGPLGRQTGGGIRDADRENRLAAFYSGCDVIRRTSTRSRFAIGTNRVWITDDIASGGTNTWRVLPFDLDHAATATDPRPGGVDTPEARQTVGVPVPALGNVVQLRWASPTRLYAVYHNGIVRHDDDGSGNWTTTLIRAPGTAGPDTATVLFSDLAPIPETDDFYVTSLGNHELDRAQVTDTLWFWHDGAFLRTNLRFELDDEATPDMVGPLDPAHSVCLDPDDDTIIYVGTLGGIYRGVRADDGVNVVHSWDTFMEGLPITCVSEIRIWKDPSNRAGAPKLLRAATQSRGVWEVHLDAEEPSRTYLRVHPRDDRRILPSPLENPRRSSSAALEHPYESPDVVIRPARRPAAAAPIRFPFASDQAIGPASTGSHHLWTFQTAFRWHFPCIRADGVWSDQLADLIRLYRTSNAGLGTGNRVTLATWNKIVRETRLAPDRSVSTDPAHPFAVFETPWHTTSSTAPATEVDVLELVQPLSTSAGIWRVRSEPCTVDVLLHHRDTRPVDANDAYVALFFRVAPGSVALLAERASTFDALHEWRGTATVPVPAGWTRVGTVHRLPVTLDAFMPKAISIDVDLSAVPLGHHVLFLAVCGSSDDPASPAPEGLSATSTIVDMARAWPRAALRLVKSVGVRR